MFEQLTVPARQVLAAATVAAAAIGSHEVEGAHLLFGFVETPSVVHDLTGRHLRDGAPLRREVKRITLASTDGHRPGFGDDVARTVAMAWGISVGRGAPSTGTATVLLALLTLAPRSVQELCASQQVNLEAFRLAVADVDDSEEPTTAPPGSPTWTVRIGPAGPGNWDDR